MEADSLNLDTPLIAFKSTNKRSPNRTTPENPEPFSGHNGDSENDQARRRIRSRHQAEERGAREGASGEPRKRAGDAAAATKSLREAQGRRGGRREALLSTRRTRGGGAHAGPRLPPPNRGVDEPALAGSEIAADPTATTATPICLCLDLRLRSRIRIYIFFFFWLDVLLKRQF